MFKILSLSDFQEPLFDDVITAIYTNKDGPIYSTKNELQQKLRSFNTHLHDFPIVNITPEMLATRETSRAVGARDLFLPVQDSAFKKIANIWREKGLIEAARTAAGENPNEITYPLHWLSSR